jgi:putative addiction module component (TIGR02574 family)
VSGVCRDYLPSGTEHPMNKALREQVMSLPPDEKYELVMDLWDSIPESELPPVLEEQIAEAERRFEAYLKDPRRASPWREVMERIRARFK